MIHFRFKNIFPCVAGNIFGNREAAEGANKSKSEFLAVMSHELRTPLNAILGFSEIIHNQILGPMGQEKYREYAGDINESGEHLLNVINDILDLSKVDASLMELIEGWDSIFYIVKSSIAMVKVRAINGGVKLTGDIADQSLSFYGDQRKLKQIIINLLTNAVKFTNEGDSVTVTADIDPERSLCIRVADTGIGTASENITDALSPFVQIDSDLHRKYAGIGLGLPLTKSLVELHQGTLEIESTSGEGTTVILRFLAERVRHVSDGRDNQMYDSIVA